MALRRAILLLISVWLCLHPTALGAGAGASSQGSAPSFHDGFDVDAVHPSTAAWTTEHGPSSFLGRTQLRDWESGGASFPVTGGNLQLLLETYNPTGPSLYGSHAKTRTSFQPGPGLAYELTARVRLTSVRPGIVYGIYFYGCNPGPCDSVHDELDIELVTNGLQSGGPMRAYLNRYAAEPLGAGHPRVVELPGFDPLQVHEWKIRWAVGSVVYYLDGHVIFGAVDYVPYGPMQANVIAWAPGAEWSDAYDASLQPTDQAGNQPFVALVDDVAVTPVVIGPPRGTFGDFDGDGRADLAVYRHLGGTWLVQGQAPVQYGISGDIPVPGDYNGDGQTEMAVYRPLTQTWMVRGQQGPPWSFLGGFPAKIPVPADYDGDGRTDAAMFETSSASVAAWRFTTHTWPYPNQDPVYFGLSGDQPLPADVDGDGRADLVVYRPSTATWYTATASSQYQSVAATPFGLPGDMPLTGDVDGDGRADFVLFRPSLGRWFVLGTAQGSFQVAFGAAGDVPMLIDVTGDGVLDFCLWTPATGTWHTFDRAGTGAVTTTSLGAAGDVPVFEPPHPLAPPAADFDGDGLDDLTIFRNVAGVAYWYQRFSAGDPVFSTTGVTQWGLGGDIKVPGDYDGDRRTDYAVYRPSNGVWYLRLSAGGTRELQWGLPGDIPVPSEFDGDGRTDPTVYRPATGEWFVLNSSSGYTQSLYTTQFLAGTAPAPEDQPLSGDFDGDRLSDFVVFRPSNGTWYFKYMRYRVSSAPGVTAAWQFGLPGDIPRPLDANGDGLLELGLYRGHGDWYTKDIVNTSVAYPIRQLGLAGDAPVPHDYDGDGITDLAVWRPGNGMWYLRQSSNDALLMYQWGLPGDQPVLRRK